MKPNPGKVAVLKRGYTLLARGREIAPILSSLKCSNILAGFPSELLEAPPFGRSPRGTGTKSVFLDQARY